MMPDDYERYYRAWTFHKRNHQLQWGEGSILGESNPAHGWGIKLLTQICIGKLARRGEPVEPVLARWAGVDAV